MKKHREGIEGLGSSLGSGEQPQAGEVTWSAGAGQVGLRSSFAVGSHGESRGDAAAARAVFDAMPRRDAVAWNAMLTAYARAGQPLAALALFTRMRGAPDAYALTAALSAATALRCPHAGAQLHARLLRLGLQETLPVGNALVAMYARCARADDAARAFREMRLACAAAVLSLSLVRIRRLPAPRAAASQARRAPASSCRSHGVGSTLNLLPCWPSSSSSRPAGPSLPPAAPQALVCIPSSR